MMSVCPPPAAIRPRPAALTALRLCAGAAFLTAVACPAARAEEPGAAPRPPSPTIGASVPPVTVAVEDATAAQIRTEIEAAVKDPKVTVTVQPLFGNRYRVTLGGALEDDKAVTTAKERATAAMASLKKNQGVKFVPEAATPVAGGLTVAPGPDDPRATRAKTVAALAQRFFDPDEVKVAVQNLPARKPAGEAEPVKQYRLKLSGRLGTVARLREIREQYRELAAELDARLKALKGADASEQIHPEVDDSDLRVTPESVIRKAFAPVAEATGATVSIARRTERAKTDKEPARSTYAVALSGTVASLPELHTAERLAVRAVSTANRALEKLKEAREIATPSNKKPVGESLPAINLDLDEGWTGGDKPPEVHVTGLYTEALALKDQPTSARWPIGRLGSAGFADLTTGTSPVDAVVTALNGVFGTATTRAAHRDGEAIHLTGTLRDVRRMKSLLALADSAHPQIRLQFWSVQVSGDRKSVPVQFEAIQDDIRSTQERIEGLHVPLVSALLLSMAKSEAHTDPFFCRFYAQMFGLEPWEARNEIASVLQDMQQMPPRVRSYSKHEILILLGLLKDREAVQKSLAFYGQAYQRERMKMVAARLDGGKPYQLKPGAYYLFLAANAREPEDDEMERLEGKNEGTRKVYIFAELAPLFSNIGKAAVFLTQDGARNKLKASLAGGGAGLSERDKVEIRAVLDEDRRPVFAGLIQSYSLLGGHSGRETVRGFYNALQDYYDLTRALGMYTFPQGRYLRKEVDGQAVEGEPSRWVGKEAYYAAQYHLDQDGVPLSENPEDTASRLDDVPDRLVREGDETNAMLASIVQTLQADIEATYLKPLLGRIRANESSSVNREGVTLSGRTELTVSDHQTAVQNLRLYSYAQSSAPRPFTAEALLAPVAPAGPGGSTVVTESAEPSTVTTTNASTTAGLAQLLTGLPLAQRVAISAAFLGEAPPSYARVAPGVSVNVTPSAALSGSTANLKLDTDFGVAVAAPDDTSNPDLFQKARPSGVESDHVTTRVEVDGFRLFQVSSAGFHTSVPQGNGGVPILSRIPLLGPMFQWGRAPAQTSHQSLLVVNAVIVPEALNLANFYGAVAARNHQRQPNDHPLLELEAKPKPEAK